MSPAWSRATALVGATRGGRRRARDGRLAAYREFGATHGWAVRGLVEDLSQHYPVAPLVGARSAQAELALVGDWRGRSAVVASVLVQPAGAGPGARDVVVQLTTLAADGAVPRPAATWSSRSAGGGDPSDWLHAALGTGAEGLHEGDQVAMTGRGAAHARVLGAGDGAPDLAGPLWVLAALLAHRD